MNEHRTKALPLAVERQAARDEYERLLNEVINTTHALITRAKKTGAVPDDSRIHDLVRELRDEFGPEVPE